MAPTITSLASTLHEIRTPIQTILGTAELLKTTSLDSEQQEYVRQIAFSADVIYTLANDILDFEKLRTGNLKLEHIEFNPIDIIEQVLNLVSIEAYNKGIELISDIHQQIPQKILGDPLRVQQILLNIVKNAVKFTSKGYISVKLQVQDDKLLFSIIDSGVGVPQDKKTKIFQAFTQASSTTTREYGGSGLGLNICAQLVSIMEGDLGVQDNPEGGSIFYFTIPLHSSPNQEEPIKHIFPADSHVLIVDDNSLYLKSISRIITNISNLQVTTATSGEEALRMMKVAAEQYKAFSLILMDLGMPAMDGWRLAAEINKDPLINGAKLFLMIPEGQLGGEAKMKLLSWFNGYLYKPIKRQKLQELLITAFEEPLELPTVEKTQDLRETQNLEPQPHSIQNYGPVIAVDDHPVNLKILTTFLTSLGVEAYGAESGRDAIKLVEQYPQTQLIFMDIEMPFVNGFETSNRIRDMGFKGIIIACSANSAPDIIEDYLKAGINDYLAKPFKKQQLADLIQKWQNTSVQDPSGLWDGPQ